MTACNNTPIGRVVVSVLFIAAAVASLAGHSMAGEPPDWLKAPFDAAAANARQKEWANYLKRKVAETNTIGMAFTLIPPGEFMMGRPDGEKGLKTDDCTLHKVKITKPFYLGTYHVTRGQFRKFVEATKYLTTAETDGQGGIGYVVEDGNPSEQKKEFNWHNTGNPKETDEHPVVNVSWHDAVEFCRWLSKQEGKEYRLPTEAQWEYAARAGTTTHHFFGDDDEDLAKFANVADATLRRIVPPFTFGIKASDGYALTAPVGSYRPNPFGLYDIEGNAGQWCADWYGRDYYKEDSASVDPQGPKTGTMRVNRGGSWAESAFVSRCASRGQLDPSDSSNADGFRVVLVP